MNWTTNRPDREGYYWFRCSFSRRPTVVNVHQEMRGFSGVFTLSSEVASADGPAMADWDGAEWFGPLEPPP